MKRPKELRIILVNLSANSKLKTKTYQETWKDTDKIKTTKRVFII